MILNFLKKLFCRSSYHITASGRTDTGKKRQRNEDSFCVIPRSNLFIVADGMGGHKAGDVASKTAVDTLAQYLLDNKLATMSNQEVIRHTLIAGFIHTNEKIMKLSSEVEKLQGMGSTMIASFVADSKAHLCHVGDVRGYIFKNNTLKQLTKDHSFAAELIDNTEGSRAKGMPPKNIVSRAIGFPFKEDPEYNFIEISKGDRLFLCSDGLWGMLEDHKLQEIIATSPSPEIASDTFIKLANDAGGKDNISVVSIFVD